MNMLLMTGTDFFAQFLRKPEGEEGSGETPPASQEGTSEGGSLLGEGDKAEDGDDGSPKSLLGESDDGEGGGSSEGAEPPPELNKDGVIESLGEDFVVQDQEKIDEFFELLSNEKDPNKVAENALRMLTDVQSQWMTEISENWNSTQAEWQQAAKEHPEFGGENFDRSLATAKEVALKYGGNEFLGLLNLTGAGNHPEMIAFLNKVYKDLPHEGSPVTGSPTDTQEKSLADKLFGG